MNTSFENFIAELKLAIQNMVVEINEGDVSEIFRPSQVWIETLSLIKYMQHLSAEDFLQIRYHCELFTGLDVLRTYFGHPDAKFHESHKKLYNHFASGLPSHFQISEPPCPSIPFVLGTELNDNVINGSIIRYQICLNYLYRAGIEKIVEDSTTKPAILEIGSGHGGLAHSLFGALKKKLLYIMVDLPEMFIFSAPYIKMHNPDAKIYIYNKKTFTPDFIEQKLPSYDFAFIPNFAMQKLSGLSEILFMLNVLSFQEMTGEQVDSYLEFAKDNVKIGVYSDNYDCHFINKSDLGSVTDRLEKLFSLYPAPEKYADLQNKRGVIEDFHQFRRFIALNDSSKYILDDSFSADSIELEEGLKNLVR